MTEPISPTEAARCPTCRSDYRHGYQRGCHGPMLCDPWHRGSLPESPAAHDDPTAERLAKAEELLRRIKRDGWASAWVDVDAFLAAGGVPDEEWEPTEADIRRVARYMTIGTRQSVSRESVIAHLKAVHALAAGGVSNV